MRQETIGMVIGLGLAAFFFGFLLNLVLGLVTIKAFPYFLGFERYEAEYCFTTRKDLMTKQELISCSDIEFRESMFRAAITAALLVSGCALMWGENKEWWRRRVEELETKLAEKKKQE